MAGTPPLTTPQNSYCPMFVAFNRTNQVFTSRELYLERNLLTTISPCISKQVTYTKHDRKSDETTVDKVVQYFTCYCRRAGKSNFGNPIGLPCAICLLAAT